MKAGELHCARQEDLFADRSKEQVPPGPCGASACSRSELKGI